MNNTLNTLKEIREERMAAREELTEVETLEKKPHESFLAKIIRSIEEAFSGSSISDPYAMA